MTILKRNSHTDSATLDAVFFKNDEIQSGDMNADGKINLIDLLMLRKSW